LAQPVQLPAQVIEDRDIVHGDSCS
jgi:hypothetical protein